MSPDEIKQLRADLEWTQRQLAEHLDVTVTAVAHWEAGHRKPNRWLAEKLEELVAKRGEDAKP